MLSYYKTEENRMVRLTECRPGCWINCVSPDDREVNGLISTFDIEPDFFRAAMDEEESSHIDHEGNNTLIVIDIPIVEKEGKSITYTTMPLGIILTEKNVITVSIKDNPENPFCPASHAPRCRALPAVPETNRKNQQLC